MSFSRAVEAMRSIVGRRRFVTAASHTCALFRGTLAAGGGWTWLPTLGWGRARANLRTRACWLELDVSFAPADVRDSYLDRIAEAVPATPAAADQRGRQLVQLEVVAVKAARRDVALEDIPEADEQARRDHTRDLALERRLPAQLEQALLEQPGEAEFVRAVLELRRVPLALRRLYRVLVQVVGQGLVRDAELAQQRPVHDEVGVATDRRSEVTVGRACKPRVAELPRVIARPLERLEHERRKGLAPAARLAGVLGHQLAGRTGEMRRLARADHLGNRWRRDAEVGEARKKQRDRLRLGSLVHPVERLAATSCEQARDALVRENHQLLDEHVRVRLRLAPRALHSAAAVESEDDLGALDAKRTAGEAPFTQTLRKGLGAPQRRRQLLVDTLPPGEDRLRAAIGQPLTAADHGAVETRLALGQRDLDGHAEPLDVRPQRAQLLGQLWGQHRRNEPWDVDGEGTLGRTAVERRAGLDEPRDVCDVHEGAVLLERERVVEVLR